jgi:hypothetical protein
VKFVVLIYTDNKLLDALPAGEFESRMRGCLAHADELKRPGKLLDSQMLGPPAAARSVRVRGGKQTTVDGPFAETKEMIAGFNLIEAEDMDEALRIASKFPWSQTGCVEVRPVLDIETVRESVAERPGKTARAVVPGR